MMFSVVVCVIYVNRDSGNSVVSKVRFNNIGCCLMWFDNVLYRGVIVIIVIVVIVDSYSVLFLLWFCVCRNVGI